MLASPRPVRLRRDPASRFLALLAGTLLALAAAADRGIQAVEAGDGSQPHPVLRDFQPTGRYAMVAENPKDATARVFFSARAQAFLVRDCATCCAFLLRTGTGVIEGIPQEAILCRDDGGCDLREDVATTALGRFDLDGVDILFRVPGLCGRLKPPPPLLGWQRSVHLLDHTPEYGRDAKAYTPDAAALAALKARPEKIQVFVYFGSWCQVCQTLMGRILRVEHEITGGQPLTSPCEKPTVPPAPPAMADEPKPAEPKPGESKPAEPAGMTDEPSMAEPPAPVPAGMEEPPKPPEPKPPEPKAPEAKKGDEPKKPEPKRPAAPPPATGAHWSIDYYGLPPAPGTWDDPEAKLRDIDRLPMLVVYVNDKYVGKIAAMDASRPELALLKLLKKL